MEKKLLNLIIASFVMLFIILPSCEKEGPKPEPKPENVSVTSVSLDKTEATLKIGETLQLSASILPENATNKNLIWSSVNSSMAGVDNNGLVTAVSNGEVKILVTTEDGSKTAACKITILKDVVPVESVTLNASEIHLSIKSSYQLLESVLPKDADNKKVEWTISDNSIATVDKSGLVNAIKPGDAIVTVTTIDGNKTAECKIIVDPLPTSTDYIDEYGINHGKGTMIDGRIWAPVNCGYHAENYKYGKLYQWGRKDGFGYDKETDGSDALIPSIEMPLDFKAEPKADEFYKGIGDTDYCWMRAENGKGGAFNSVESWNNIEGFGDKLANPCPEGWRVPTKDELTNLTTNRFPALMQPKMAEHNGQKGYWYSGYTPFDENGNVEGDAKIFLPAAGFIYYTGTKSRRTEQGRYWSATKHEDDMSAWYLHLEDGDDFIIYYEFSVALTIRCVK